MVRDSLYNIERNTKATAGSAASAAHHGATTARAAQSAAAGAWVGAGFQAVNALQNARAARAAQEQLEVQHAMAEQAQTQQFAMWRQTPDGAAFTSWRDQAVPLAQLIRGRRAEWQQVWAQVIGRFQSEVTDDEKDRFAKRAGRLTQPWLRVGAVISLVLAGVVALVALLEGLLEQARIPDAGRMTYEQCLAILDDPDNILLSDRDCAAIAPVSTSSTLWTWAAVFLAVAVSLVVIRAFARRAARRDTSVNEESAARIARFGFDPLAVTPGWEGFAWNASGSASAESYADSLMHLALTGHRTYPPRQELFPLRMPVVTDTQPHYPQEINAALTRFRS
nr:hypothetical protein [Microbacterium hydrocarbonoxydans]